MDDRQMKRSVTFVLLLLEVLATDLERKDSKMRLRKQSHSLILADLLHEHLHDFTLTSL